MHLKFRPQLLVAAHRKGHPFAWVRTCFSRILRQTENQQFSRNHGDYSPRLEVLKHKVHGLNHSEILALPVGRHPLFDY